MLLEATLGPTRRSLIESAFVSDTAAVEEVLVVCCVTWTLAAEIPWKTGVAWAANAAAVTMRAAISFLKIPPGELFRGVNGGT